MRKRRIIFDLICIVCVEVGHNITRVKGVDVEVVVVVVIVVDVVVDIEDESKYLKNQSHCQGGILGNETHPSSKSSKINRFSSRND